MVWLFAILAVLSLGVIAVVASGRGTPLEEAYDDRPDAVVPAGRPLVADDLRRVRFSLAFRGYRMSEVDELLQRIAAQIDDQPGNRPEDPPPPRDVRRDDTPPPRGAGRGDTESH